MYELTAHTSSSASADTNVVDVANCGVVTCTGDHCEPSQWYRSVPPAAPPPDVQMSLGPIALMENNGSEIAVRCQLHNAKAEVGLNVSASTKADAAVRTHALRLRR